MKSQRWLELLLLGVVTGMLVMGAYARGYRAGTRENRDAFFCLMDRLIDEARPPSHYCVRFDSVRDETRGIAR